MLSLIAFLTFALLTTAVYSDDNDDAQQQQQVMMDANDFCSEYANRRNQKDMYPNPDECHTYYQCFYLNDTTAVGILRQCPLGQFWNDALLQCLPEGPVPCVDQCSTETVAMRGCYGGGKGKCALYYLCSNGTSYPFCCPRLTRFNAKTCQCESDYNCQDVCQRPAPPPTTIAPPIALIKGRCIDSFGNILIPMPSQLDRYLLYDGESGLVMPFLCVEGTHFDAETCRCEIADPTTPDPHCIDTFGNVHMPDPNQPDRYLSYDPKHGRVTRFLCVRGMQFNSKTCRCELADSSPQQQIMTTTTEATMPTVTISRRCVETVLCMQGTTFNFETCRCEVIRQTPPPPPPIPANKCGENNKHHCVHGTTFNFETCRCEMPAHRCSDIYFCPQGTYFDFETCSCERTVTSVAADPLSPPTQQCILYLPFDADFADHSRQKFSTLPVGTVSIDHVNFARGSGSLFVNSGWVEVPGMKTLSLQKSASWCLFYRINNNNNNNNNNATSPGGLLSNNKDASMNKFSVAIGIAANNLVGSVGFDNPRSARTLTVPNIDTTSSGEFLQMCMVYDGATLKLYVENKIVFVVNATGDVKIANCPYVIGTDALYGNFYGNIDEVLVCSHALSAGEVDAHYHGRAALENEMLVPAEPIAANYSRRLCISATNGHCTCADTNGHCDNSALENTFNEGLSCPTICGDRRLQCTNSDPSMFLCSCIDSSWPLCPGEITEPVFNSAQDCEASCAEFYKQNGEPRDADFQGSAAKLKPGDAIPGSFVFSQSKSTFGQEDD